MNQNENHNSIVGALRDHIQTSASVCKVLSTHTRFCTTYYPDDCEDCPFQQSGEMAHVLKKQFERSNNVEGGEFPW